MKQELTPEQIAQDEAVIHNALKERQNQIRHEVQKIRRNHKLYMRQADGVVRRLDKISQDISDTIILGFIKGDLASKYAELNKDVKHWTNYKPLSMFLDPQLAEEFAKVQKACIPSAKIDPIIISYNGTWQPLVAISMKIDLKKK